MLQLWYAEGPSGKWWNAKMRSNGWPQDQVMPLLDDLDPEAVQPPVPHPVPVDWSDADLWERFSVAWVPEDGTQARPLPLRLSAELRLCCQSLLSCLGP